jgi:hypothetical protein
MKTGNASSYCNAFARLDFNILMFYSKFTGQTLRQFAYRLPILLPETGIFTNFSILVVPVPKAQNLAFFSVFGTCTTNNRVPTPVPVPIPAIPVVFGTVYQLLMLIPVTVRY